MRKDRRFSRDPEIECRKTSVSWGNTKWSKYDVITE